LNLNMICLDLNLQALTLWGHQRRLGEDYRYLVHAATRKIFGDTAPQPFLVQEEKSRILGYTAASETQYRERFSQFFAETSDDAVLSAALSIPEICIRAMPCQWEEGSRYRFSVFCRPMSRMGKAESDVWLLKNYYAFKEAEEKGTFCGSLAEYRRSHKGEKEEVYKQWLQRRFGNAAELQDVVISGSRTAFLTTRGQKDHTGAPVRSRRRSYPETTFTGNLCITHPEAFERLLRHGVGRHCAFGFGMLLLEKVL
jgi:CRISPR system Cascade subunit CasE